jgi:aspartokinase-like uncharacterized kinase
MTETRVDAVIKVGGSLLRRPAALARVTDSLAQLRERLALLVVPGGGLMADTIRDLDQRFSFAPDTSHWMAVLAMDQYALLLSGRIAGSRVVRDRQEIACALDAKAIPVLAPYRWLEDADPLPHSWSVTSDSIAAWVAGAVGAPRLVLVKAVGGQPESLVDEHFSRALPTQVESTVLAATEVDKLEALLV